MLSALAAALFLLEGCAGEPDTTIDITFDPCRPLMIDPGADTTPDEMRALDRALELWNESAGAHLARGPHAAGDAVLSVRFERSAPFFFGVYDDETGAIYVNRSLPSEEALAITVAHELGHAFGLSHVDGANRSSVMNPANLEVPPSAEDAQDLTSIWGDCRAPLEGTP